jgi:hypothetical protein
MSEAVLVVRGVRFLVPPQHLSVLTKRRWYLRDGYAISDGSVNIATHIARLEGWDLTDKLVDHIDGNRQDNRIENLRRVTHQQNVWNRGMQRNNTSGFRGVSFDKRRQCWEANIRFNKVKQRLGRFDTPEEASAAYEAKAKELFGEYLRENPKQTDNYRYPVETSCPLTDSGTVSY